MFFDSKIEWKLIWKENYTFFSSQMAKQTIGKNPTRSTKVLGFLCVRARATKRFCHQYLPSFQTNSSGLMWTKTEERSYRKAKCLVITYNNKIIYVLGNNHILHRLAREGEGQNMNMLSSNEKPVGKFFFYNSDLPAQWVFCWPW